MARVFQGEKTLLSPILVGVERIFYGAAAIRAEKEQSWLAYTLAMLTFNALGYLVLYALLRLQAVLPLNPQGFAVVAPSLAFYTAISFTTNTNWQAYGGETTMSHFAQMAGLAVQNFLSAVILLDLGLPDMDGKDVIAKLRAWSKVPIVVLSARDREAEKIAALDLGADDYVNKPFGIGELMARLRTALRHASQSAGEVSIATAHDVRRSSLIRCWMTTPARDDVCSWPIESAPRQSVPHHRDST